MMSPLAILIRRRLLYGPKPSELTGQPPGSPCFECKSTNTYVSANGYDTVRVCRDCGAEEQLLPLDDCLDLLEEEIDF